MCTVLTQDHKCTSVYTTQGLGRHMTSVREGSVEQAGARVTVLRNSQVLQAIRHIVGLIPTVLGHRLTGCNTLHVGALSPFLMVTSKDSPVIWDVSRGPAQYAGIKPPSVNFTNLNASALPEWHSQPLPTTDSTTGSLSRTVMIRSSCNWACQCLAPKAVTLSRR